MTSSSDAGPESRLLLPDPVRETLHERAAAGAPEEVCGVLVGERAPSDARRERADRVAAAVAVPNVADEPESRYELDPAETLGVIEDAESAGDDIVGFYHSHPRGPAEPSAIDRERATWPGHVYCILTRDGLAAYRWTGDEFRRLRVESS
ncbi:desampylase [Halorarum halobium]|uniref:desampylase n=1 Tax=Halorarum halobium TaxID=3075121 RepID=UPI0028B05A1F|nr:desampylase [Halobaculum sp. XH14]